MLKIGTLYKKNPINGISILPVGVPILFLGRRLAVAYMDGVITFEYRFFYDEKILTCLLEDKQDKIFEEINVYEDEEKS